MKTQEEIQELPGVNLTRGGGDLMVAFTYACNHECLEAPECSATYHLQEKRPAIRGKLAGTGRCFILTDPRWRFWAQSLPPIKV